MAARERHALHFEEVGSSTKMTAQQSHTLPANGGQLEACESGCSERGRSSRLTHMRRKSASFVQTRYVLWVWFHTAVRQPRCCFARRAAACRRARACSVRLPFRLSCCSARFAPVDGITVETGSVDLSPPRGQDDSPCGSDLIE